ncbi:MAG: hypothetical protein KDA29_10145 [Phycisphaerales bacterium]|nr:hypothetical protein [Phycisphaerales bacterium]
MHSCLSPAFVSAVLLCGGVSSHCVAATPQGELPITEITAFKDGHALVVRAGAVALDAQGDAVLTDLPRPVLGTFWADEREERAALASVVSERVEQAETLTASSISALLRANIGARIAFLDPRNELREGRLLDIIQPGSDSNASAQTHSVWNGVSWQPQSSNPQPLGEGSFLAIVETESGVATVPVEQIRDLRFLNGLPKTSMDITRQRERMTLDLEWEGEAPDEGDVRLMYVQKGVRWIPSYRVTVIDDEHVRLELQATIVNELADLDDVTMHFAVGVPSFAFADSPDPMGLQNAMAGLGPYFRAASETGAMFSNAIMSQTAMSSYDASGSAGSPPASPELSGSERAEDLFVYTVDHISLRRGARMVVPLVSYEVCYESLYRLEIPARPPFDATRSIANERRTAIERALSRPIPTHVLRIINDNDERYPITTAPALIIKNGRTLAQGMLGYTAPGGTSDLEVGKGVEIGVETSEHEGERELKAVRWNNNDYARARVDFSTTITNRKDTPVRLEVVKIAFGEQATGGQDAQVEMLSPYDPMLGSEDEWNWWRGYNWPWWWGRFNGAARFRWDITIEAGEHIELDASWVYYWQ